MRLTRGRRITATAVSLALGLVALGLAFGFLATTGLPRWSYYALPWLGGLAVVAALSGTRSPWQAVGAGLMSVPVWDTSLGILASFGPLLQGGLVLRAYTTYQLSGVYSYKLVNDLGYLGAGFILYAGGAHWWRHTPRSLAVALRDAGLPLARREGLSIWWGFLGFPLLLIGTLIANYGLSGLDALRQSDESSVFANMTPYHALALSLAAAFGEELLYRGLVQTVLSRRLPMAAAIVVQAVFFGFAHSGYATWIHVLLPTLFGLVAGVVAWRLGIWASIVLHVLVDIVAFGAEASATYPWMLIVLNLLLLLNLGISMAWAIHWLSKRAKGRRAGQTG